MATLTAAPTVAGSSYNASKIRLPLFKNPLYGVIKKEVKTFLEYISKSLNFKEIFGTATKSKKIIAFRLAYKVKVKVNFSRHRPSVAQRMCRVISVLFLERVSGQQHAPAALYPRERPGNHFTGGWVGPRAGLDGRKISSLPGFDSVPSSS